MAQEPTFAGRGRATRQRQREELARSGPPGPRPGPPADPMPLPPTGASPDLPRPARTMPAPPLPIDPPAPAAPPGPMPRAAFEVDVLANPRGARNAARVAGAAPPARAARRPGLSEADQLNQRELDRIATDKLNTAELGRIRAGFSRGGAVKPNGNRYAKGK